MGHGKYIAPPAGEYRVQAGEKLELSFVVLPGESRDITYTVDLLGPGAEAHIKGLYLCKEDEKVNIHVVMHHAAEGCHSTQLIKGIAGGRADVHFGGTIVVAPDAQQTEAFQENHNIVLTETAKVETLPQQFNEDELFYMRSRGIPEAEARTLQMLSFLSPVIPQGREAEIEAAVRGL